MPISEEGSALRLKDDDDVAVALRTLVPGRAIRFLDATLMPLGEIPGGHKIAVRPIAAGAPIHKYGQVIGRATVAIAAGEHVHVHNVEGVRGRGDLAEAPAP